ncbi:S8 family serine peptidase [Anaerovorax odorimutans]|uniref:S8 family serine peptidase n=1 Tax=Anaerovorax odorimutans TaxID=109327 RepID=A0ABT1RKZ0_9FIRM|nr:S8 family serine peptidase [Anaerovorax odorimutans]MCQ4635849.1 S8 family serine peptidase [Anaerovorax odorimutans]
MSKRFRIVAAIVTALAVFLGSVSTAAAAGVPQMRQEKKEAAYKEGEAIVLFKDTSSFSVSKRAAAQDIGLSDLQVTDVCNFTHAVKPQDGQAITEKSTLQSGAAKITSVAMVKSDTLSTEKLIEKLKQEDTVKYAFPNFKVKASALTNDTFADSQWALNNTGQNAGTIDMDLNPEALWNSGTTGSSKVVAVIDTGVDYIHDDLKDNMWINPYTSQLPGKYGYDFCNDDSDPMDDNDHGTHCAGIIGAAGNNGAGISGINQRVKIMALKVLDANGEGDTSSILQAYEYISRAQDLGVPIAAINNSYGFEIENAGEISVIRELNQTIAPIMTITGEKGALSFSAAGNSSANNDHMPVVPAGADSPYNIAVAASDAAGNLAPYSNYGRGTVDLAAPGSQILSTVSHDSFTPGIYSQEKRDETCSAFADYEDDASLNGWGVPELVSFSGRAGVSMEAEIDKTRWFNKSHQSLNLSFKGVEDQMVYFMLPYTVQTTDAPISVSLAVQSSKSTSGEERAIFVFDRKKGDRSPLVEDPAAATYVDSDWRFLSLNSKAELNKHEKQERELIFAFSTVEDGDCSINLDQVGISKENVSSSRFGKYTFLSGTSMATPYAAGAAALVSAGDPALSALEVAATLKKSVRNTASLQGKVASGGTLDLARLSKPQAVTGIALNRTSAKVKKGTSFTLKASVYPYGAVEKGVTWRSSNSKIASVDKNGTVRAIGYGPATITAVSKGKGQKSASCKVTGCYTINYKKNKGTLAKNSPTMYYNQKVTLKKPTRSKYAFKGWYTDKKYKHKIKYIKKGTRKNYTLYAKWSKVKKPGQTRIKKLKKITQKKMSVSYKRVSGAHGYQIKYSRSKKFKKKATKTVYTRATSKKIKGLKKNKRYYVKVRAYKVDSKGKKIYGKYSKRISIK